MLIHAYLSDSEWETSGKSTRPQARETFFPNAKDSQTDKRRLEKTQQLEEHAVVPHISNVATERIPPSAVFRMKLARTDAIR
jgi:hypothetical protein